MQNLRMYGGSQQSFCKKTEQDAKSFEICAIDDAARRALRVKDTGLLERSQM